MKPFRAERVVILLLLAIAGCDQEVPPGKPTISRFEAQPMIVERGSDTKLVWTVSGAERIFVRTSTRTVAESVDGEGVAMARGIAEDTLFTLEAMNAIGSSFATVRVAILRGPPPAVDRFTVDPTMILLGEEATLTWETTNATERSIETSVGEVILGRATEDGSLGVSPEETTTYVLKAISGGGSTRAEVTLTVDDPRPTIVSFTASPASIPLGAMSTLAWEVTDAEKIVISQGPSILVEALASGTATVAPETSTEYELAATNTFGTRIARVTLEVVLPAVPIITTFRAAPNPIARGASTVLEFVVDDADVLRIFEGETELEERTIPFGSLAVTPPSQPETTYRLEAENDVGVSTATLTVWGHLEPVVESFRIAPNELAASTTASVAWSVREAQKLELFANGVLVPPFPRAISNGAAVAESAQLPVRVEKTTFFELGVISAAGRVTARAIAVIGILESEPNNVRLQADAHPGDGRDGAGTIEPGTDVDWYSVAVPANGNISAKTTDATGQCAVDTVLTVYGTNGTTVIASDDDGGGGACSRIDPAEARGLSAGTYYVAVSSKGATGDYAVAIRTRGPGCGNTFLEGAEECDDGDTDPGDGCSATCTLEGAPEDEAGDNDGATAPGVQVTSTDETFFGSISPIGDVDFFAVTMPDGYNLEAYLTVDSLTDCPTDPKGALALIAPNAITELASNDSGGPSGNCGRIAIDTTNAALRMPGGTYFLRVREAGDDAEIATYFLHIRIVPAGCGNGLVEPGEACDDGDQTSNDGCDASCQWEIGPSISPPGGTANVSLTEVGGAAIVRINVTIPGQSIGATAADPGGCDNVDTALELYDDNFVLLGSQSNGGPSGSAGICARLIPGVDAFSTDLPIGVHYLFVRSEGGTGNTSLTVHFVNPACGNNIREARANEHCDDGNVVGGDGCSSVCLLEGSSGAEMEPNGTQAQANPTALVGIGRYTVIGANTPAGDDDVFSFVVPVGPQLRFSARTYSMIGAPNACDSNRTDTRLLLERTGVQATGPGTGELAYNDDRDSANNVWCSEISNLRLGSGTYYLRVQGWNDTQVTGYLVDFTLAP